MNPILRNILAVITGLVIGNAVNMGLIMISGKIIPPPEGADFTTAEGLKASLHLLEPKHYVMPFLAHALGTFAGALAAALIAATYKMRFAIAIAIFFLAGGIIAAIMIPAPTWFIVLDLVVAYLPMGYIAGKIGSKKKS